ncbi:nucleoporin Nup35 [Venturia canescens]|uniref:nucleoporin Nup35 n=1 Tax=Venturia canescens TaxID=32260 RepID=UPI001C9CAD78|nr:nucleoporin Nup35 [Venturia canescens]
MEPMALGSPVGSPVQTPGTPGSNSAYLPGFLLGESTPARLGMIPESPRYSSAGSNSGSMQSPLSNFGTPDYRHNRQKAMFANTTSPSGGQMNLDSHTGGPPTRGLFDTLEVTQSPSSYGSPNNRSIVNPHKQSSRLLSNTTNDSFFFDNIANLTSSETPSQGLLQWVTVFGFPPNTINTVLSHISNRVRIVDKHPAPHPQSNWIHLKCATEQEAQRALTCNGNIVSGPIMIGVTPCMDEGVILTPDKENRGKFNGSMRIVASPGKSNDPTSLLKSGHNLRSPIKIQNARPLATGYNQHLSPQAVRSPESVPQRSTGLVSKAMEYVFGW